MRHLAASYLKLIGLATVLATVGGCASGPHLHFARWHAPRADLRDALTHAEALEDAGSEACVEAYYEACSLAWQASEQGGQYSCDSAAVARLLLSAQRFGRLDPARGLLIYPGAEQIVVPATHHGFPWKSADFQRLHPPTCGHEPLLARRYVCAGLGAPLVVERCRNDGDPIEARFLPTKSFFAATAILRFEAGAAVLEFHNPVLTRTLETEIGTLPLAADLSAPLARMLDEAPRTYLGGFLQPGQAETAANLHMLEPYEPGKTPVVLVHGLFSDPLSWADLVNDLRATPEFAARYRIWYFRYPTGQGFLQSAAALRRELRAATHALDPERRDQALRSTVLIGHSMGGLIAKLQVTHSDDQVWTRLANRPLEQLVATDEARALLAETCYFEPSPDVARVIFIATPHAGSLASSGLVGCGASLLVEPAPEPAAIHDQLVQDNPGVFNPQFEERLPTSIDMLQPRSPLLAAMRHMRIGPGVRLHTILAVWHPVSLDGPSDGVVSVHSAWHPDSQTTLAVSSGHGKAHRSQVTSAEVLRILGITPAMPR